MGPTTLYLSAANLQSMETLGYCTVTVSEETSANLTSAALSGSSYTAKDPSMDPTTFQAPLNRAQLSNATATTSAPLLLTASQSGTFVNNGAASTQVGFKLPVSTAGMEFTFMCTAAAGIQLKCSGAETIQVGTSTSTATTGHVDNTAAGSVIRLVCYAAGTWMAVSTIGTWAVT